MAAKLKTDKTIKTVAEDLLKVLQIEGSIEATELEDATYRVDIETPESGLLIGFHGDTLASFQLMLSLMVHKKLDEWVRITVEVGDYRAKREVQLRNMAESYAARVKATGEPQTLPYLSAADRRIIHLYFQDDKELESESVGEGENRRITIKPRAS